MGEQEKPRSIASDDSVYLLCFVLVQKLILSLEIDVLLWFENLRIHANS
jgi:hypothetical protein